MIMTFRMTEFGTIEESAVRRIHAICHSRTVSIYLFVVGLILSDTADISVLSISTTGADKRNNEGSSTEYR